MRQVWIIMVFILPLALACERNDEAIVPRIPPSSSPAAPPDTAVFQKVKPALDFDSELYQYGRFADIPYRILVPRHYDSTRSYPLHIFLHGISERGSDNEKQLKVAASAFQADSVREKYPAFVVFPQCPKSDYWFSDSIMHSLKGLIDTLVSYNDIDTAHISLGGFSMGAYGTFAMVPEYPGLFEAAIAISGAGDEHNASLMTKTRWQIFAGNNDRVVPGSKSRKMAEALQRAGASVWFTLYKNGDHYNTWTKALSEPDLFSWLFSNQKDTTEGH